jgi:hypothetical protein
MGTGIATLAFITALTRIYKIRKNGGVTDLATEIFEYGSDMIVSSVIYLIIMSTL